MDTQIANTSDEDTEYEVLGDAFGHISAEKQSNEEGGTSSYDRDAPGTVSSDLDDTTHNVHFDDTPTGSHTEGEAEHKSNDEQATGTDATSLYGRNALETVSPNFTSTSSSIYIHDDISEGYTAQDDIPSGVTMEGGTGYSFEDRDRQATEKSITSSYGRSALETVSPDFDMTLNIHCDDRNDDQRALQDDVPAGFNTEEEHIEFMENVGSSRREDLVSRLDFYNIDEEEKEEIVSTNMTSVSFLTTGPSIDDIDDRNDQRALQADVPSGFNTEEDSIEFTKDVGSSRRDLFSRLDFYNVEEEKEEKIEEEIVSTNMESVFFESNQLQGGIKDVTGDETKGEPTMICDDEKNTLISGKSTSTSVSSHISSEHDLMGQCTCKADTVNQDTHTRESMSQMSSQGYPSSQHEGVRKGDLRGKINQDLGEESLMQMQSQGYLSSEDEMKGNKGQPTSKQHEFYNSDYDEESYEPDFHSEGNSSHDSLQISFSIAEEEEWVKYSSSEDKEVEEEQDDCEDEESIKEQLGEYSSEDEAEETGNCGQFGLTSWPTFENITESSQFEHEISDNESDCKFQSSSIFVVEEVDSMSATMLKVEALSQAVVPSPSDDELMSETKEDVRNVLSKEALSATIVRDDSHSGLTFDRGEPSESKHDAVQKYQALENLQAQEDKLQFCHHPDDLVTDTAPSILDEFYQQDNKSDLKSQDKKSQCQSDGSDTDDDGNNTLQDVTTLKPLVEYNQHVLLQEADLSTAQHGQHAIHVTSDDLSVIIPDSKITNTSRSSDLLMIQEPSDVLAQHHEGCTIARSMADGEETYLQLQQYYAIKTATNTSAGHLGDPGRRDNTPCRQSSPLDSSFLESSGSMRNLLFPIQDSISFETTDSLDSPGGHSQVVVNADIVEVDELLASQSSSLQVVEEGVAKVIAVSSSGSQTLHKTEKVHSGLVKISSDPQSSCSEEGLDMKYQGISQDAQAERRSDLVISQTHNS